MVAVNGRDDVAVIVVMMSVAAVTVVVTGGNNNGGSVGEAVVMAVKSVKCSAGGRKSYFIPSLSETVSQILME